MQLRRAIGCALCWMVLVGCAPTGTRMSTRAPESGVRDAVATWVSAFQRHDLDGIASGFADDVVALYPRSAPTVGRAANRAGWAAYFAMPGAEHPITVDTVVVAAAGDMAFTRGRYAARYDKPDGHVDLGGQYVAVWRPDAAWRVAHHDSRCEPVRARARPGHASVTAPSRPCPRSCQARRAPRGRASRSGQRTATDRFPDAAERFPACVTCFPACPKRFPVAADRVRR
jgi:uncharacterized protein (TIGR02246 family)